MRWRPRDSSRPTVASRNVNRLILCAPSHELVVVVAAVVGGSAQAGNKKGKVGRSDRQGVRDVAAKKRTLRGETPPVAL